MSQVSSLTLFAAYNVRASSPLYTLIAEVTHKVMGLIGAWVTQYTRTVDNVSLRAESMKLDMRLL